MKTGPFTYAAGCIVCALIMIGTLGGCLPRLDPGPAPVRVRLNPAMPGLSGHSASRQQLTVAAPSLAEDIDNDHIVLIFSNREVRYLSHMRWSSSLGTLVYAKLVDALESTQAFAGVGGELTGLAARLRLNSEVSLFALEYASETSAPVARFSGTFRLVNTQDAKVISSRQVDISVPAGATENTALVTAMEKAFERALAEVAAWAVENAR